MQVYIEIDGRYDAHLSFGETVSEPKIGYSLQEKRRACRKAAAARRPEKPFESTAGIIPGDRGKDGGSWCRNPLSAAMRRQAISPAPLAGVMTGQLHELRS